LLYGLVAWLVVAPICALVHELGHAVMALLLTGQDVTVQVDQRGWKRWARFGRLNIVLHVGPSTLWSVSRCDRWVEVPRLRKLWICMGGPVASLLLTLLVRWLALSARAVAPLFDVCTGVSLILLILTSFPWRYPRWMGALKGMPSDGLQVWRLARRPWPVT
jgi:hypothetical protein